MPTLAAAAASDHVESPKESPEVEKLVWIGSSGRLGGRFGFYSLWFCIGFRTNQDNGNVFGELVSESSKTDVEFDKAIGDLLASSKSSLLLDHQTTEGIEPLASFCLDHLKSLQDNHSGSIESIRILAEKCFLEDYLVDSPIRRPLREQEITVPSLKSIEELTKSLTDVDHGGPKFCDWFVGQQLFVEKKLQTGGFAFDTQSSFHLISRTKGNLGTPAGSKLCNFTVASKLTGGPQNTIEPSQMPKDKPGKNSSRVAIVRILSLRHLLYVSIIESFQ
uniref:Uncharacterized protein n=1 Tax=Ananas comosus var. bracteatus TaxID=296719 RepID=A0A6V7NTA7_ANACO|nr:unnamed protein product [Ananas comosus var. bracteatus]